jgi:hypothetical protein
MARRVTGRETEIIGNQESSIDSILQVHKLGGKEKRMAREGRLNGDRGKRMLKLSNWRRNCQQKQKLAARYRDRIAAYVIISQPLSGRLFRSSGCLPSTVSLPARYLTTGGIKVSRLRYGLLIIYLLSGILLFLTRGSVPMCIQRDEYPVKRKAPVSG